MLMTLVIVVGLVGGVLLFSGVLLYNGNKQVTIKESVVQEGTIESDYYQSIKKHKNEQQEIAAAKQSEQESKELEISKIKLR